jgi:hypothetical protein
VSDPLVHTREVGELFKQNARTIGTLGVLAPDCGDLCPQSPGQYIDLSIIVGAEMPSN